MGITSSHGIGNEIPHIPNRRDRRKRFKQAGGFKHKGGWQHVNNQAYQQRDQAIQKMVHRANQKYNMQKGDGDATKDGTPASS